MNQNKNQMSPEDTRNMFIFCVLSLVLYLGYEHFILGPQREALEKVKQAQLSNVPQIEQQIERNPLTRVEILAKDTRITIDNGQIFGTLSTRGARIDDIALHDYFKTLEKKRNVTVLSPKSTEYPRYVEHGWVSADKNLKLPEKETIWRVIGNHRLSPNNPLALEWKNGQGLTFLKNFSIDEGNLITVEQFVTNATGKAVTLYSYGLVAQRGLPETLQATWLSHEGPIGFTGEELQEISYKSLRKKTKQEFGATQGWAGITEKYFLTSIIPPQGQNIQFNYSYSGTPPAKKQKDTGLYQTDYTGAAVTIKPGESGKSTGHVFVGPKKLLELERYGEELGLPRFDLSVNFGWFWFMSKPFFYALHFLGELTGNLGVAIILLTIAIRSAVFPLTNASFKSFAKMKKVGPEITELRKKHGDDKQKLQKELMEMYQKEGVNPMAGCIPMLIQIPIFFALYKVLFITIEIRHAPFFGWIQDLSAPDPTSIFNLFGLIPWDPPAIIMIGVWPCLMLITMLIQRQLNPPPQDPIQRDLALYFPFILAFMMSRFASGLVIYWTFSAAISVLQQMIIMRRMNVPIYLFGESPEEKGLEKAIDKGPAVHPIAEMIEDEVEDALFDHEPKQISPPKPKKKTTKKKATKKKKK